MENHEIVTADFSFAAIVTILTGRVFAREEFDRLARFLAKESPSQVMGDRHHKWIPWLLVQFPFLHAVDDSGITSTEDAMTWLKKQSEIYPGPFTVRAVYCK